MYKLYAQKLQGGWEKIAVKETLDKIEKQASKISAHEYYSYLIIKNEGNGDETVKREVLSKECKVEFVDDIKSKVEVKAMTFKPSKMKQKEELRKLTEEYIDR